MRNENEWAYVVSLLIISNEITARFGEIIFGRVVLGFFFSLTFLSTSLKCLVRI